MQFINILMLFGLAAVAIPIIIQILTRKNASRIKWGAWLFLDATMKKRKRKVLLEDILLLAARCLALGLLALAFARPFVRPDSPVPWAVTMPVLLLAITLIGISFALWRYPKQRRWMMIAGCVLFALAISSVIFERWLNLKRFGLGATKDVVIIVDGSASMSMIHDGKSNFEKAIEEAKKYVEQAPRNTSFSVIIGGPVPQVMNPVPIADKRVIINTLERIVPCNGTLSIGGNLTAAAVTLAAGHNAVKQIVIVGDGQTVGWNIDDVERWKTMQRVFSSLKTQPIITWRTLPLPTSIRNLAIESVRPSRAVVGTDREVDIAVKIVNAGTESVTPKGLEISVEGKTMKAPNVHQLAPGESQIFSFTHRFKSAGGKLITAKIEADDDLPSDDCYRYSMPVLGSLKVLIVDGDAALPKMSRASTYVSLALRPEFQKAEALAPQSSANDAGDKRFLLETVVEDLTVAGTRKSFNGFSAVILSSVRHLPENTLEALARFVNSGGGLFFMPGAASDAKIFNNWSYGGSNVLPAPLGKWIENKSELGTESLGEMLSRFRTGSDLGTVAPERIMTFGEGFNSNTVVIAKLKDKTPLILHRTMGRGSIVQSSVLMDPASGFVTKRSFLPMIHELVYSLSSPTSVSLDIIPQESVSLLLSSGASGGTGSGDRGIIGIYYPKRNFEGKPIVRTDKSIRMNLGNGSPMKGIPSDDFSIKWRGVLVVPEDGTYTFDYDVDDRFRFRIGGKDGRRGQKFAMKKSETYPLYAEYEEDSGVAFVSFKWKGPNMKHAVPIPESAYLTQVEGGEGAGSIVEITDPHGETFYGEIYSSSQGLYLRITRSVVPGVYTVSDIPSHLEDLLVPVRTEDGKVKFSVSSGVEESTMEAITQDQLSQLCKYVQISQAIKDEDVIKAIGGQSFGKEVWRVLAFAAFLFLVAEPAIARWIAINRRTGDVIDTEGAWIRT